LSSSLPAGDHSSVVAADLLLAFGVAFIGLSPALDRFIPFGVGPFAPTFLVGTVVGALGYWRGITEPELRRYFGWIAPFLMVAVISLVAANQLGSLRKSGGTLTWLVLVPGIAVMVTDRRRFRALLSGLVIGSSVLLTVVVYRYVRGASVLDKGYLQFLGEPRNGVDITIVWLIPIVMRSKTLGLPRLARWVFLVAAIIWLISSEGRTGFIALLLIPGIYFLLKPATLVTRATRLFAAGFIGFLVYASLVSTPIPGIPATERISRYSSAERTQSDEIRLLLNEKSIALTKKHPVFGVGFFLYEGQYDPVIEKGRTEHIRSEALILPAHNSYYNILATTGIAGFLFYVGALLTPLLYGVRASGDTDARALTTAFFIVLFCITFHTSGGSQLPLAMAVTLAAAVRARLHAEPVES
jgi:hypothetical protein